MVTKATHRRQRQRPTGITILAILEFIGAIFGILGGIALLVLGGVSVVSGGSVGGGSVGSGGGNAVSGADLLILGVVALVIGVVDLVLGYGFWTLQPWARLLGIGLQTLGLVVEVISIVRSALVGTFVGSQCLSIFISVIVLLYLNGPEVRQAFDREPQPLPSYPPSGYPPSGSPPNAPAPYEGYPPPSGSPSSGYGQAGGYGQYAPPSSPMAPGYSPPDMPPADPQPPYPYGPAAYPYCPPPMGRFAPPPTPPKRGWLWLLIAVSSGVLLLCVVCSLVGYAVTQSPSFKAAYATAEATRSTPADFPWQAAKPQTVATGTLSISGSASDFISQGRSYSYSTSKGDAMTIAASSTGSAVHLQVDGHNGVTWTLGFAAPGTVAPINGKPVVLVPGTYNDAHRMPQNGNGPGLDLGGDGRGCNTVNGSFTIIDAVFGPPGYVQKFDATFVQHCEGLTPAASGEVHISNPPVG